MIKWILLLLFLIVGLGGFSCSSEDKTVYPGAVWETSLPQEQGIDPDRMMEAVNYLESKCLHNGVKELVIIKNGYMIYRGDQIDSVHNIWSCSKTFTSTVLGLLIDDGVLSLEETAASYEPLLKEYYPNLSFRHFVTMTSGYSAEGESRWEDVDYADWSWTPYTPEAPLFPPGSAYAYWDEAQMMFGRVLTGVLGKSMHEYLSERIMNKIGISSWMWYPEQEHHGVPINNGCTNVFLNAEQFARWGWLFLNNGAWNGEQLISSDWVRQATSVQVAVDIPVGETDRKSTIGPGCYGFNWWVNGELADGSMKLPGAPEGCYFASGLNNNKCIVIPEWNMVVVRMGEDGHPANKDQVYEKFLELLGESLTDKAI